MDRYARSLPLIGQEGQAQLSQSKVLIVGLGGLGCPAALYVAASGVGTLGLLDHDVVEESNLARQVLHTIPGVRKTTSAARALKSINPTINIREHPIKLTEETMSLLADYDVIIDCVDDPDTKLLLNRACHATGKVLIFGAAIRDEGQVAVLKGQPCLACFFKSGTGSCAVEGILPPTAGLVGVLQAREALNVLLKRLGLQGLLVIDENGMRSVSIQKNPACTVCGLNPAPQKERMDTITPKELKPLVDEKKVVLVDVREQWEWNICHINGAILIPMRELPEQLDTLDKHKEIVFYCHTGSRSGQATRFFNAHGFHARNLVGGIARWTEEVDPSLEQY